MPISCVDFTTYALTHQLKGSSEVINSLAVIENDDPQIDLVIVNNGMRITTGGTVISFSEQMDYFDITVMVYGAEVLLEVFNDIKKIDEHIFLDVQPKTTQFYKLKMPGIKSIKLSCENNEAVIHKFCYDQ